ncbi:hypothetical protein [Paenibacillus prosopidis]|uniref:hypothetical protein n=1 Tax=Paenibacillus prosopidis TaxID=630520 RepID=UPI000DF47A70|nr:hypothetical protein [Paenibacillus prosopidis]
MALKLKESNGGKSVLAGMDGDDLFSVTNVQMQLQQIGKSLWSDDQKKVLINNNDVKAILERIKKNVQSKALVSPVNPTPSWLGQPLSTAKLQSPRQGTGSQGCSDAKTMSHLDDYMMLPAPVVDGGSRYRRSPITRSNLDYRNNNRPYGITRRFQPRPVAQYQY